jgi:hypothetical protein
MAETRIELHTFFEEPEGKKSVQRLWYRWNDDIKTGLKEIIWDDVGWTLLTRDGVH